MGKYGKTMSESYREVLEWTVTTHELQEKKKVSKREIDKLEDGNEHGMVALKLAQSFGTPKEVKTVQDINKRHNRAGSIEHKDQKERDAIIRKYYDMAEEKLDEAQKDIDFARAALTKANIKHVAKQHPMKRSKIIVNVSRKDYKAAEKALGKEFSSQGDNIMLGILESTDLDEGRMKDIVTDVKDALGKIRHRVSQKGSKFIVSVDSNDEEDAQKAMKNHPLYVAGKLRVIPEEIELDEKFKVGDKVKVKKGTMGPTQRHYEKTVGTIIKDYKDGDFKVNFGGYDNLGIDGKLLVKEETELDEAKFQVNYSKNNKLYSKTINAKDEDDAEEKAIKMLKIDDDDIRSVVKEALDEVTMTKALNIDPKDVDRMKVLTVLYTRAMKLPSGSPIQDKIKKEIAKLRKQLGMNEAIEQKLDEMFDYVLIDKDNKIVGRYSGKNAKKEAESGKGSAHLPPMRIPKNEVGKMKIIPISPKDKKGIGDMVLAIGEEVKLTEKIEYVGYKFKNSKDASSAKSYFEGIKLMTFDVNDDNISNGELMVDAGNKDMTKYHKEVMKKFKPKVMVQEKKLTDAEMKKREEIAKAIEKDDPDMPMDKKMAIATATAKRVAEEEEPDKPDTAKKVDQMRDDKKKTRIAQLQLQIAKATETINKLNTQEK